MISLFCIACNWIQLLEVYQNLQAKTIVNDISYWVKCNWKGIEHGSVIGIHSKLREQTIKDRKASPFQIYGTFIINILQMVRKLHNGECNAANSSSYRDKASNGSSTSGSMLNIIHLKVECHERKTLAKYQYMQQFSWGKWGDAAKIFPFFSKWVTWMS